MGSWLLLIGSLALAWFSIRRGAREDCPILSLGLTPMLAASFIIATGNFFSREQFLTAGIGLLALSGLTYFLPSPPEWRPLALSRGQVVGFSVGATLLLGFVLLAQQLYLDTDNWIHEPLIATYMRGIFPPVHPFFPEVGMNGHYGRDLLIASITPARADPLGTVWLLNPLFAISTYFVLFGTLRRYNGGVWPSLLATWMAFFGICVGIRVGLADAFDGNNGVVYALASGLFYWMFRVLELDEKASPPWVWLLAGFQLGIYQLVYETHFGLLLLTAFLLVLWTVRSKRVAAGVTATLVLALGLAFTEGGPFTDLAKRAGHTEVNASQQNVAQHVSLTFPKSEFLKAKVTKADYQRISVAFQAGPFRGLTPRVTGEGYMSIFDPRFFYAHWLPLYLSPFVLCFLWKRRERAGLAFWLFGAWAYLIPGLVDFGPVYEWEYFRWEFAAGYGFAISLGLALGQAWQSLWPAPGCSLEGSELRLKPSRKLWQLALLALLLLSALLPGEKMLNDTFIKFQKQKAWHFWPADWRVAHPDLGVTGADIQAMDWLSERVQPGDQVLSNLGNETPFGLWPDSILATRTGAHPSGRARPPQDRRVHAHPNYHRSPTAKLFYQTGRLDLLASSGTDWLLLDLERFPHLDSLKNLEASPVFQDEQGHRRQVFALQAQDSTPTSLPSSPQLQLKTGVDLQELRAGSLYQLSLENAKPDASLWIRSKLLNESGEMATELSFQVKEAEETLAFATPLEEGSYQLVVGLEGSSPLLEERLVIDFRERLGALEGHFEMPDQLEARKVSQVELLLKTEKAISSQGELELQLRFVRSSGEPVWELDGLSQPLNLQLAAGQSLRVSVPLLSPWEPGVYQLQGSIKDLSSGRTIHPKVEPGVLRVVER